MSAKIHTENHSNEVEATQKKERMDFNDVLLRVQAATQNVSENLVLTAATCLNFTSGSDYREKYWKKKFLQTQVQMKYEEHTDPTSIFFPVYTGDKHLMIKMIAAAYPPHEYTQKQIQKALCELRDVNGATIAHVAYLFKHYKVAHYLLETYPLLGLQSYGGEMSEKLLNRLKELDFPDPESYKMPYSGETVLHIVIVRKNHDEVRWLLDVYRNRNVVKDMDHQLDDGASQLFRLLNTAATGTSFGEDDSMYYGGYPLHFAACTNDTRLFDLVLSYCAHTRIESLALDTHNIFQRDQYGNTILHLCVMHCLQDMYKHVHGIAYQLLNNQIIDLWTRRSPEQRFAKLPGAPAQNTEVQAHDDWGSSVKRLGRNVKKALSSLSTDDYGAEIPSPNEVNGSKVCGHAMKERLLVFPDIDLPEAGKVIDKNVMIKVTRWAREEAYHKVNERLALVLNKHLHSPLTLAGAQLLLTDSDEVIQRKRSMLSFMIGHLKESLWTFGPLSKVVLDLDGLERRHNLRLYDMSKEEYEVAKAKQYKRTNCDGFSCMESLCHNSSDTGFLVEEIALIVRAKWERVGFSKFLTNHVLHGVLTVMTTLILVFMVVTPTSEIKEAPTPKMVVNILYPICVIMYFSIFLMEMVDLKRLGSSYTSYKVYGIAGYDFKCRLLKMLTFVIFCIMRLVLAAVEHKSNRFKCSDDNCEGDVWPWKEPHGDFVAANNIILATCVLISWFHMFYFLMGYDATGPIMLTIFRVITKDVVQFLIYYLIVVLAFACVLSVLANQGSPKASYGFKNLGWSVYNLMQLTVQADPTNFFQRFNFFGGDDDGSGVTSLELPPTSLVWLMDGLQTVYLAMSNILMINLLIGMITSTFERYTQDSSSIILMEKFNIMAMLERSLQHDIRTIIKGKYSRAESINVLFEVKQGIIQPGPASKIARSSNADVRCSESITYSAINKFDPKNEETVAQLTQKGLCVVPIYKYKFEIEDTNNKWEEDSGFKHQSKAVTNTTLFLICPQCDFHKENKDEEEIKNGLGHPEGSLAVPNANEDSRRIAAMIREHMSKITNIIVSLDSHYPLHIAHSMFWKCGKTIREEGGPMVHPDPFTKIKHQDVVDNMWVPVDPIHLNWCLMYTYQLEQKGRMVLTIWPKHCIIGSRGHTVVPIINEALQEWVQSSSEPRKIHYVLSGQNVRSEMYSALEAEVVDPVDNSTSLNVDLLGRLTAAGRIVVGGQAMSHCVNYTVRDMIKYWTNDLDRIVLLSDGASAVEGFEQEAEKFVEFAREKGVTIRTIADAFAPTTGGKAYTTDNTPS